jgi:uncharacterized protein YbjT (DUF2867 family)
MKVLLTGANGYIGMRLLPALVEAGHEVVCAVREPGRFNPPSALREHITVIRTDLLDPASLDSIPVDIDGAYYLVHSMAGGEAFAERELRSARNFQQAIQRTQVRHVVYLSGMVNDAQLSDHLASRFAVEEELARCGRPVTTLRAGIIIGSGSASFEIIRDLVEKLPVMIAPRWLNTRCQPIGIHDVLNLLTGTLFREDTYGQSFDIGGPDVLTYREMLLGYARARGLKRWIGIVPVMTPKLSSYWLYFITSTSYPLAISLVDSMKVEVVCRDDRLLRMLGLAPMPYDECLRRTLLKVDSNAVVSSWKDALESGRLRGSLSDFLQVPVHGCFHDHRRVPVKDRGRSLDRIWRIGGRTGWYHADMLWRIRGFLDKLVGGVGLRRGRTHDDRLDVGDAVDFWRVLYADRDEGRLLLFAEMRLPGEAWLEFRVEGDTLHQTATFRPKGVLGRLYWYAVLPLHGVVFRGMAKRLAA